MLMDLVVHALALVATVALGLSAGALVAEGAFVCALVAPRS